MESQLDDSLLQDLNEPQMDPVSQSQTSQGTSHTLTPSTKSKKSTIATSPDSNKNTSNFSSMALLSPPGSRYFQDSNSAASSVLNNPISPLLSTTDNPYSGVFQSNANFNSLQRPSSAQDFNIGISSTQDSSFDAFRPFSAQGGFNTGIGSINSALSGNNKNIIPPAFNIPDRPLSSMEIDSITFKNDVSNFVNWINTLNTTQHRVIIDNLLNNLPEEILQYTRMSLDGYQNSAFGGYDSFPGGVGDPKIVSPQPIYQSTNEPATLDSVLNGSANINKNNNNNNVLQPQPATTNLQRVLSPNFPSFDRAALLQETGFNRPRSADPYHSRLLRNQHQHQQLQQSQNQYDASINTPSKSRPSNRFDEENQQSFDSNNNKNNNNSYDITNLAQQLTQTTLSYNEFNNANALKLSALSTINSRAQLDSGKKRGAVGHALDERGRSNATMQYQGSEAYQPSMYGFNDESNVRNSSSVPPVPRVSYYDTIASSKLKPSQQHQRTRPNNNATETDGLSRLASLNSASKLQESIMTNPEFRTPHKVSTPQQQQQQQSSSSTPKSPAINPKQITSSKLLNDISAWLKSLRLHKYTNVLQDVPWQELIYLNDKQLEEKGVSALGARGKLLKAFEVVKEAYESGNIKE